MARAGNNNAEKDLLFEIGTEEIPAGFIPKALGAMGESLAGKLKSMRLGYKSLKTMGTPRRLVFIVEGLPSRQPDVTVEVRGPRKSSAYDDSGNATKTLLGFIKAQGVSMDDVKIIQTEKGECVAVVKEIKGEETERLLHKVLASVI